METAISSAKVVTIRKHARFVYKPNDCIKNQSNVCYGCKLMCVTDVN